MGVVKVASYLPLSLYSGLDLDVATFARHDHLLDTKLFHYERGEKDVPQLSGRTATLADTNTPRSGRVGLPRYQNGHITRWRAKTPFAAYEIRDRDLEAFLSSTTASLEIMDIRIASTTLYDLVTSTVVMTIPVHLGELSEYHVDITCHDDRSWQDFRAMARRTDRRFRIWVYLEGNVERP